MHGADLGMGVGGVMRGILQVENVERAQHSVQGSASLLWTWGEEAGPGQSRAAAGPRGLVGPPRT